MDTLHKLANATVKIECDNNTSGTGFFYDVKITKNQIVPTIITNRHVIEGVNEIKLIFSLNDYFSNSQKVVEKFEVRYEVTHKVIYHSDQDVDLCALIITPIMEERIKRSLGFQMVSLSSENIPTDSQLKNLRFVEDVTMIGYPNGIFDKKNNFPIFRGGQTATHPGVDFEGREECIIDMTITPGSSGSPVFIYNSNGFNDGDGTIHMGERLIFLGVNKAVYVLNTIGEIVEIPSPTRTVASSQIGINLGIIIKAKAILDIEEQIKKKIQSSSS